MITAQHAVMSLRPDTEWVMNGGDVEGIIWQTPNTKPLTQAEVDAEVVRLQAEAAVKAEANAAATAAAIAHAKSLGFTDEMIAVMYPNLGAPNV
jgi:UDP-N-acetylmuramyl pentapeptide synthase